LHLFEIFDFEEYCDQFKSGSENHSRSSNVKPFDSLHGF